MRSIAELARVRGEAAVTAQRELEFLKELLAVSGGRAERRGPGVEVLRTDVPNFDCNVIEVKRRRTVFQVLAFFVVATALAAVPPVACAQSTDEIKALRQAVEALRESQQRIERELQDIKTLLRGRPSAGAPDPEPKNIALSIDGDPVKGDASAKFVLVDFTDYQ